MVEAKSRSYAEGLDVITHCNLSVTCFTFYGDCAMNYRLMQTATAGAFSDQLIKSKVRSRIT